MEVVSKKPGSKSQSTAKGASGGYSGTSPKHGKDNLLTSVQLVQTTSGITPGAHCCAFGRKFNILAVVLKTFCIFFV